MVPGTRRGRAAGAGAGDGPAGCLQGGSAAKKGKEAQQVSEAATPLVWAKRTNQGAESRYPSVPAHSSAMGQQDWTGWSGARTQVRM